MRRHRCNTVHSGTPRLESPVAAERFISHARLTGTHNNKEGSMNGIIYLVGLIVIVMFILSFLGLS